MEASPCPVAGARIRHEGTAFRRGRRLVSNEASKVMEKH